MYLQITPLRPEHADIVPHLRHADIEKIHAMTYLSPALAVAFSIAQTERGYAAIIDGKTAAIFGVAQGVIWLVATDEINNYPVTFYRTSKKFLPIVMGQYETLYNFVHTIIRSPCVGFSGSVST